MKGQREAILTGLTLERNNGGIKGDKLAIVKGKESSERGRSVGTTVNTKW